MPLGHWKKLRQHFQLRNPWWTYRKDVIQLPSGQEGEYHYVHVKGSSMIIPFTDDGKIIIVNQYRYLADKESWEFPCGSVKEYATYDETAAMELAEETGYRAEEMKFLGKFNPYNGVTDEMCHVYLATGLRPGHAEKDSTEEFEYAFVTAQELEERINRGDVWDGMTLAAWSLARHQFSNPELNSP